MVKQEKGSHQSTNIQYKLIYLKQLQKKHNKIEIILRIINALLKIRSEERGRDKVGGEHLTSSKALDTLHRLHVNTAIYWGL